MKKNYVLAACLFLAAPFLHAQVAADETKKTPYIEVTGSAEMEIVPDEIYIQVTLQERYEWQRENHHGETGCTVYFRNAISSILTPRTLV
jgi:uncharacterized protein YggE